MSGRISIYTVDVQLNPPNGVVEPAIMLESEEDGYLFVVHGLFVTSVNNLNEVKITDKQFIVSITI